MWGDGDKVGKLLRFPGEFTSYQEMNIHHAGDREAGRGFWEGRLCEGVTLEWNPTERGRQVPGKVRSRQRAQWGPRHRSGSLEHVRTSTEA